VLFTRVLAAVAVAALSIFATGAATASATVGAPSDARTILVKWQNGPPPGIPAVGELKTRVKIVKVPPVWTVDQTLAFYRMLPNVVYAEPNYVADQHGLAAPDDYWWPQQWGLAKIDTLAGWDVYPGTYAAAGAPIAVVDTGIDATHPDLAGQVSPGANCLTGVCVAGGLTIDDNGHGTVNAGAAAAAANNNRGIAGLAHGARLIPVKVLSSTGTGTYAAIAAGIIWAADNGAKVINLSLGGLAPSRTLCDAVTYALDKGAFVAAAAGNLGTDTPVYPAACPGAVGVGATDQNDSVPPWSDTGPDVFVSAPGVSIHATYPGDRYALATGTSVSTALVSGLASLLEAQNPARTPADIRRILASTSDKIGPASSYGADPYRTTCAGCTWSARAGYGRIDVLSALSAPPPSSDPGGQGSGSGSSPPVPAPDFSLAAGTPSASVVQGDQAHYQLAIQAQNGFDGIVSLAVAGLPAGATAAFAPASVPASGSSALTVGAASGTPAGSYPLTVTATSGALSHTVSLTLTVTAAAPPPPPNPTATDFSLSVIPGSRIVKLGSFAVITVRTSTLLGPLPGVDLSVAGLPAGVTGAFSLVSPGVWTLRLDAASTATRFLTSTLTVTGRLGTYVHSAPLFITVM
jgi:thermitase